MQQDQHKHTLRFWRRISPAALKGFGIIAGAFLAGFGAYMATKTIGVVENAREKPPLSAAVVQQNPTASAVNPRQITEGFVYTFDAPQYLQEVWNKTPHEVINNSYIQWGVTSTSISGKAWENFAADTALHSEMATRGIRDGQLLHLAVRNTSPNLIVIRGINAVVLKKYPRGNAWFMDDEDVGCGPGGQEMPVRTAVINFFHDPPKIEFFKTAEEMNMGQTSPVSIGLPPDDVLLLDVIVRSVSTTVDWELYLMYLGKNGEGRLRVNENGKPFRVFDPERGFHILHRERSQIVPYMPPC